MDILKGNAVVGQSGGPTAAINATLAGVIRGCAGNAAVGKLYGMRNGVEGLLEERLTDLTALGKDGKQLELLSHTPAAALGSCRKKLPDPGKDPAVFEKLLAIFKKFDVRYFFYIGGNDSMDTVAKLSAYLAGADYEMRVVGVPKTIDNDLVGTDHTPGFGSAAKYIATTVQEILCDCAVYTVPAVTIVEIMGRDAGWLTAASALGADLNGRAPDLIYLPERAFDEKAFFEDVRKALSKHPNVVIAVSEGIRFADGRYVCEGMGKSSSDVFGHKQLSGTGKALELAVKEEIGCKVRSVELNISQRCASHVASAADISESLAVGAAAVDAAVSGVTREMMCLERASGRKYAVTVTHKGIDEIANLIKTVPDDYINARGNGVTPACVAYLAPLIEGEALPVFVGGVPRFFRL